MGDACSTLGMDEKFIQKFYSENLNERDHLRDLVVEGRIILRFI